MGFLTLLFNGFCELVGSFFKIILFFVVLILGSIAFGKFGNAHKLKDGYFDVNINLMKLEKKEISSFLMIINVSLIILLINMKLQNIYTQRKQIL